MTTTIMRFSFLTLFAALLSSLTLHASDTEYSPRLLEHEFPSQLYWGDTHLHSSFSPDANALGNTALTPEDAYKFAKGQIIEAGNGMRARLNRPLDFLVVSDHARVSGACTQSPCRHLPGLR